MIDFLKENFQSITLALLTFTLVAFLLVPNILNYYGYEISTVDCSSHSMEPTLKCDTIVLTKLYTGNSFYSATNSTYLNGVNGAIERNYTKIDNDIKIGDIIIYFENGRIIHRVVDTCQNVAYKLNPELKKLNATIEGFYIKGDNNPYGECVQDSQIIGKVLAYWNPPW